MYANEVREIVTEIVNELNKISKLRICPFSFHSAYKHCVYVFVRRTSYEPRYSNKKTAVGSSLLKNSLCLVCVLLSDIHFFFTLCTLSALILMHMAECFSKSISIQA